LRHPHRIDPGRRVLHRRSRPTFRPWPVCRRIALSCRPRMGHDRGRRAVAAHETGTEVRYRASGGRGRLAGGTRRRHKRTTVHGMTLTLEHISKTVDGDTHIDDVSLTCAPGEFNILLGHTLAGK